MQELKKDELERRLLALGVPPEAGAYAAKRFLAGDSRDLVRVVLLAKMWDEIVPDSGEPWIQKRAELAANGFPIVDFAAMERVLASGADTSDVAALMRSAQVLALYNFANLLDGEGWQTFESLVGDAKLGWRVVVSADADVIREVGLHETVEELDPTGRHGAPRG